MELAVTIIPIMMILAFGFIARSIIYQIEKKPNFDLSKKELGV